MGSYDKLNATKEKYQKQIDELQAKNDALKEKNSELKGEIKELRNKIYSLDHGESKKLNDKIAKLEKEVDRYKKTSFANESYEVFTKEQQKLIKDIKSLKSTKSFEQDIFHKFETGMNQILAVAKIAKSRELTIRDCYVHVFRDSLICLLEKTMQILTGKRTRTLNSILYDCVSNKIVIDEKYLKVVPELRENGVFKKLQYLVYLENTAFHGYEADTKIRKTNAVSDSERVTEEFLKLNSDDQVETIFTLLKLLYEVFTSSSGEYILTLVSGCWKA